MMRKAYVMQDALAVYPPYRRPDLSNSAKRWRPEPRVPRSHISGGEEQRLFTRLCDSSHKLLSCPWCSKRKRDPPIAIPSEFIGGSDISAPSPSPHCCRIHCCHSHWARHDEVVENRRQCLVGVRPFCDHRSQSSHPAIRAVTMSYEPDPTMQRIRGDIKSNLRTQSPLSTVIIRWHVKRNDSGYAIDDVLADLEKFGDVINVVRTSAVSVRATFRQLDDACRAVARRYIGRESNPLLVLWYHRAMANKTFHLWQRHLHVHVDPFA